MKSERLFTIFVGLIYIVIMSLPRWNYDLLFSGNAGHIKILQPIIHMFLFAGLIMRVNSFRFIMALLLGISVIGSLFIMSYETYPAIIIYCLVCLLLGLILLYSKKINYFMKNKVHTA